MDRSIKWSMNWWINRFTDGSIDVLIDGSMDWSWIDRSIDRWIDGWFDQWIDWWINQCIDGWIDRLIDRWIDRSMNRSIEWLMDGWINGWMDGLIKWYMNRWIYGLSTATPTPSTLTHPVTTDFTDSNTFLPRKDIINAACLCFGSVSAVPLVSSSSLEWKSSSAREGGANLAVPIRTTTSCTCMRKRRFVLYAFLWTCRETVKSQALNIVYRAYAGVLKGWGGRWSEKCQLGRCTNQRWVDISEFFPDTTVFYD